MADMYRDEEDAFFADVHRITQAVHGAPPREALKAEIHRRIEQVDDIDGLEALYHLLSILLPQAPREPGEDQYQGHHKRIGDRPYDFPR